MAQVDGQTDRPTDNRTGNTCNAAIVRRIITYGQKDESRHTGKDHWGGT